MKKETAKKINSFVSFFIGVTLAYFIWLSWQKLTDLIGNSNVTWIVTGIIVMLGIFFGYLSSDKVLKRFT